MQRFDQLHLEGGSVTLDLLLKLAQLQVHKRGEGVRFDQVIFTPTVRDGQIVIDVEISDRLRTLDSFDVMRIDLE